MLKEQTQSLCENVLLRALGFAEATKIQAETMHILTAGRSLMGLANTGSGKTLAYLLPLLLKIEPEKHSTQLLILAPTRELGAQIAQVASGVALEIGKFYSRENFQTGHGETRQILVRTAFGGTKSDAQKEELQKCPHIIVATPGRILEFIEKRIATLKNLKAFVLDEADLMLGMGFEPQIKQIINYIPTKVQLALFSATATEFDCDFQKRFLKGIEVINASINAPSAQHEYLVAEKNRDKAALLLAFLNSLPENNQNGLVFCQTRAGAHELCEYLRKKGLLVEELSGELGQVERTTVLRHFKARGVKFLIATNIAGRGIDIRDLSLVINFDLPSTTAEYVHRTGRTGRAGKVGRAVSICTLGSEKFFLELMEELKIEVIKHEVSSLETHDCVVNESEKEYTEPTFVKLHLNRGKSDKLRPGDILGCFTKDIGINAEDVGKIFIFDHFIHVEVDKKVVRKIKDTLKYTKIKNLSIKVNDAEKLILTKFGRAHSG